MAKEGYEIEGVDHAVKEEDELACQSVADLVESPYH